MTTDIRNNYFNDYWKLFEGNILIGYIIITDDITDDVTSKHAFCYTLENNEKHYWIEIYIFFILMVTLI